MRTTAHPRTQVIEMDARFSALFDKVFDFNAMSITYYHILRNYMEIYLAEQRELGIHMNNKRFTEQLELYCECLKKFGQVIWESDLLFDCIRNIDSGCSFILDDSDYTYIYDKGTVTLVDNKTQEVVWPDLVA